MRTLLSVVFLLVTSAAYAYAQEPPPRASSEVEKEEPAGPKLVAAAWCPIISGDGEEHEPGCDMGVGIRLHSFERFPRLVPVVAVGLETIGVGLAWVINAEQSLAVSVGAMARHDERGIHGDDVALALGATFGFGGADD